MRCLVSILLLAGAAAPENPALHEERHWRGVLELESASRPPPQGVGGETQRERIEFTLVTRPPRQTIGWARLPFDPRGATGAWELAVDMREGEDEQAVTTKGAGGGRLHARVAGYIEPGRRRYRLDVRVAPARLVAKTTTSGISEGRFQTFRHVAARGPLLDGFKAEGATDAEARVVTGNRTYVDRKARLAREVTVRWRLERIDPVVQGRVVDHHGRAAPGLKVVAWTTNPGRVRKRLPPLFKEGVTDAAGRFRIPAFWAHWNVRVEGAVADGVVFAGREVENGARLRPDLVPDLEVQVEAYGRRDLPYARLLGGHFQGDVDAYLGYVRERIDARRLAQARTK